jgi:hypothetical protein
MLRFWREEGEVLLPLNGALRAERRALCFWRSGFKHDKEMTIPFKIGEFCSAAMRRE